MSTQTPDIHGAPAVVCLTLDIGFYLTPHGIITRYKEVVIRTCIDHLGSRNADLVSQGPDLSGDPRTLN